jgi:hypothetical protein
VTIVVAVTVISEVEGKAASVMDNRIRVASVVEGKIGGVIGLGPATTSGKESRRLL